MSLADLDGRPRMAEYLKPEDLNLNACVTLAAEVLRLAAEDLTHAAREVAEWDSPRAREHLAECKRFYRSDLFKALSCGLEDGEVVMKKIIREALRGRKVEA